MSLKRREFLKLSAAAPVLAPISINAAEKQPAAKLPPFENTKGYWDKVRAQFPITKELLYFNNGTMGPSPKSVTDIVTERIAYVDRTADYGYDRQKLVSAIGRMLNCPADDIALTHNTSEGISIAASGLEMMPGDEVILTDQEHGGGAIPWLARAKRHGIVVKFAELEQYDDYILRTFDKLITDRTRIISIPHITCTTGQILPVKRLAELAHSRGALCFVDGAHAPGMIKVDIADLGCDGYASCGHKWLLGPKGTGFVYLSPSFRRQVAPSWSGAEADKHWDYHGNLEWLDSSSRYDFGTQSSSLYIGLLAAIEWMEQIGWDNIEKRIITLSEMLRAELMKYAIGRFTILTPPQSHGGITTIKLKLPEKYIEFANTLQSKYKIRTRIVPEGGLQANRFSVHIYHSQQDVETFLSAFIDTIRSV